MLESLAAAVEKLDKAAPTELNDIPDIIEAKDLSIPENMLSGKDNIGFDGIIEAKDLTLNEVHEFPTLAGVEKGREMTFAEADSGNVNPHFKENYYEWCDEEDGGYNNNCQTCVVVFEARLKGYDVEAEPFREGTNSELLAEKTNLAWLTPEGTHPDYIEINPQDSFLDKYPNYDDFDDDDLREDNNYLNEYLSITTPDGIYDFIDDTVKTGEHYTLEGIWDRGIFSDCGHIISVFKEPTESFTVYDDQLGKEISITTGELTFYDPQCDKIYNEQEAKSFLSRMIPDTIKLLRVDNAEIDCDFMNSIVKPKGNEAYV